MVYSCAVCLFPSLPSGKAGREPRAESEPHPTLLQGLQTVKEEGQGGTEKPAGRKARSCREDQEGRDITIPGCQADGQPVSI